MIIKFKEKALLSSRESVAETTKTNMFLVAPYALDSSSIMNAKSCWEGF